MKKSGTYNDRVRARRSGLGNAYEKLTNVIADKKERRIKIENIVIDLY